jgi:hypothetical protein
MAAYKYMQTDARWAANSYPRAPYYIKDSGCGPTSLAMALKTFGVDVTPADTAAWSVAHGYAAPGQGTYYTYFARAGAHWGVSIRQFNSADLRKMASSKSAPIHKQALAAVQAGDLIIACMGPGVWTRSGHYVLLWGYDGSSVYINDPAHTTPQTAKNTAAVFESQAKYYWQVTRPASAQTEDAGTQTEGDEEMLSYDQWKEYQKKYEDEQKAAPTPTWDGAQEAMDWAQGAGIIQGGTELLPDGKPNLMPCKNLTRLEAAIMLQRYAKSHGQA